MRAETGLPIVTEVLDTETVDLVAEHADCLQVGARNMQNFSLLKRLGRLRKPVLLKRGMSATIEELLLSAEYLLAEGNYEVILCERGVRTFADHTRNTLDLSAVPYVQRISHLPILVDPSHGTGKRAKVLPLSRAAVAVGADGLLIEVHHASRARALRRPAGDPARDVRGARGRDSAPGAGGRADGVKGLLVLEDGTVYRGDAIGRPGTSFGEIVFNTAMSGYQEVLTDPSYAGQIVVMTAAHVGNYGIRADEAESDRVHVAGFIARDFPARWSGTGGEQSLADYLDASGVTGLHGLDTRSLVRRIRSEGAMRAGRLDRDRRSGRAPPARPRLARDGRQRPRADRSRRARPASPRAAGAGRSSGSRRSTTA